jgi:streptogramin lyase
MIIAIVAGLALAGCGETASPSATSLGSPAATATAQTTASAAPPGLQTVDLDEVASLEVELERGPDWPTELDGSLWVLLPDVGEPAAVRLDPETGAEQASIPVDGRLCQGMIAAFDALWACSDSGMVRIDPARNAVAATIAYPSPQVAGRPAASEDAVWALAGNVVATSVVRIDPATNAVTDTYELGHVATNIAYGDGALWITSPADGVLLRLDSATGKVGEVLADLPAPTSVAAGTGAVWVILYGTPEGPVANGEPALLRHDPQTGETERLDVGGSPAGAGDLLATDDAVWVRGSEPLTVRLNPQSGAIEWAVSRPGLGDGSLGLAFDALWVTSVDRGTVWRIDR